VGLRKCICNFESLLNNYLIYTGWFNKHAHSFIVLIMQLFKIWYLESFNRAFLHSLLNCTLFGGYSFQKCWCSQFKIRASSFSVIEIFIPRTILLKVVLQKYETAEVILDIVFSIYYTWTIFTNIFRTHYYGSIILSS